MYASNWWVEPNGKGNMISFICRKYIYVDNCVIQENTALVYNIGKTSKKRLPGGETSPSRLSDIL